MKNVYRSKLEPAVEAELTKYIIETLKEVSNHPWEIAEISSTSDMFLEVRVKDTASGGFFLPLSAFSDHTKLQEKLWRWAPADTRIDPKLFPEDDELENS